MADNKQLPATGTGTANIVVGTDEIAGVDYQQIKLLDGTLGSTNAAKVDGNGSLLVNLVDSDGVTVGIPLQAEIVGPGLTQLPRAEDTASVDGHMGIMMLGVRNDGPSNRTSTDGDYSAISVDDNGRPRVVVDAFNPGTMTTKLSSPTGTLSNVSASASSVTVLASNGNRRGASIWNDSTAICYLKFGATASTTSCTVKLIADAYYEVPFGYTGIIDGIWAAANGSARVTEIT